MRSFSYIFLCFVLFCTNALADCGSDDIVCTSSCVLSASITKQFGGGNECLINCLTATNACEARDAQRRQMEEQQQQAQQQQQLQAAERQAQQARDAKEIAGKRQSVQQAAGIAQRANAEGAIEQQFDTAVEKGMQALDQKGYVSAEYQFKTALKIKPNDMEAKTGLLRALVGAGRRAAAFTYANEQLLKLASKPPGTDGHSAYALWLEVLSDVGLTSDAQHSQLKRIYPFGDGDPERAERAATTFLESNLKSPFLPFVHQIRRVLPAMSADYADRRREAEAKLQLAAVAEANAKEELAVELRSAAVAEAKAKEKAAARLRAATNARVKVIKDCDICPDMATIPSGEFEMGSNIHDSQKPIHSVNVNAFAWARPR